VIDPDAEQLAAIAVATGESAMQLLGMTPEVAMLSFSTNGSARHAAVSKVSQATALAREMRSTWRIVGEVQLDAAVLPEILQRKAPEQATEDPCNVLIFPTLDAGNIGYKLIQRFGGAQAIGPILQGLAKPVNDLSRGCSTSDIVNIIAVSAAQVRSIH
jgi:phosphate acetyltransferase